ncbi:hypothetical protein J6590_030937 [Homalodisca vitripennis]|nr:hypothetical protein J6590_030937 [Homalodisca vitripennis]
MEKCICETLYKLVSRTDEVMKDFVFTWSTRQYPPRRTRALTRQSARSGNIIILRPAYLRNGLPRIATPPETGLTARWLSLVRINPMRFILLT